jgi:triosephosphate isomerase
MIKKKNKDAILVINFKTYAESSEKKAEELAKIANKVAKETNKKIIIVVQETDIYRIARLVDIPVYSEHLDPIEYGAHTGKVLASTLKYNGASGVLLNHSEDRFGLHEMDESIRIARKHKLGVIACANDEDQAAAISVFKPDYIAVEPPELIGGNISVSTAKPEIIEKTVKKVHAVKKIPVLCGAGVKRDQDVIRAIQLGAKGILVASGIVKAKDPEKKIKELVEFL